MARTIFLDECGGAFVDKERKISRTCNKRHEGNALMKTAFQYYECSQAHVTYLEGKEVES